jgi:optic atrophy 3 protein
MAQAIPVAKLGTLLVKTLSKPLSKQIKIQFSQYPIGQRILEGVGQGMHNVTSRLTIWSSGYRVRSITPLEQNEAIKQGADFVGEFFVVTVSAGLLIWEYNRSNESAKAKEMAKQAVAQAERDALQQKLITLDVRLKALEEVVKANQASILHMAGLGGKTYQAPKNIVKIRDDDDDDDDEMDTPDANDVDTKSAPRWWRFGY